MVRRFEWTFYRIHIVQRGSAEPILQAVEKPEESIRWVPFNIRLVQTNRRRPDNVREVRESIVIYDKRGDLKRELRANDEHKFLSFARAQSSWSSVHDPYADAEQYVEISFLRLDGTDNVDRAIRRRFNAAQLREGLLLARSHFTAPKPT